MKNWRLQVNLSRKGILGAAAVTAGAGLLSAFSSNYVSLIIFRCVAGVCIGDMNVINSWFLEFVPTSNRVIKVHATVEFGEKSKRKPLHRRICYQLGRFGRKLSVAIMFVLSAFLLIPLLTHQNEILTTDLLFGARAFVSTTFIVACIMPQRLTKIRIPRACKHRELERDGRDCP